MIWNYSTIKEIAKEEGLSVKDLLALSPANDPFYVSSKGQTEKAMWFAQVYENMGCPRPCHIRRVHYWLVSQEDYRKPDGQVYLNTANDWNFLTLSAKYARYIGVIPIENIIDRRNPEPIQRLTAWEDEIPSEIAEDSDEIISAIVRIFHCFNECNTQAYHIELWSEKSTMDDVLVPIVKRYGINLVKGLGELSITAVHDLVERMKEIQKPVRIFYISDFDPAGECMPVSVARKIEYFMQPHPEFDVKLKQIILTAEQCREYNLPRTPIKVTEKRKENFEERHGIGATELDALESLHPGEMERIIVNEILDHFGVEAWNEVSKKNREIRKAVEEYLEGRVPDLMEEIDLSEFDEFEPPRSEEIDDDDESWLYDSSLDYEDQIEKYKEWRNKSE